MQYEVCLDFVYRNLILHMFFSRSVAFSHARAQKNICISNNIKYKCDIFPFFRQKMSSLSYVIDAFLHSQIGNVEHTKVAL